MSIDVSQSIVESWQVLIEYIPEKSQAEAAEHIIKSFSASLSKKEMLEIISLDSDLAAAYDNAIGIEEEFDDEDDEDSNSFDYDE